MDSKGHIHLDPTEEDIKKKKLVKIPDEQVEETINMNRAERRKWYRENKKKESK